MVSKERHATPRAGRLHRTLGAAGATLALGWIMCFWSERLFWTVWNPGDSWAELAMVWIAYSALAGIFAYLWLSIRPAGFLGVFLAGAAYGWATEGGLTYTLYGTEPSAPFPVSLAITGLSWHALLTVGVGVWGTVLALAHRSPWPTAALAIGVGVFWGLWGMHPWGETPPVQTPVWEFLGHAAFCCALVVVAWWVVRAVDRRGLLLPSRGVLGASIALILLFYVQYALRLGPVTLLLPLLLGVAIASALRLPRAATAAQWRWRPAEIRGRNLLVLMGTPLAATLAYAAAGGVGADRWGLPVVWYYGLSGPTAVVVLGLALVKAWRGATAKALPVAR